MIEVQSPIAHPREPAILSFARSALWTGEGLTFGRMLLYGAMVCFVYSVLAVLIHGVTLDQDLVPAQVIAGAVHYPPGHPHGIFYPRVFNLPTYFLAGLWKLIPSAVFLSALRNCVFVFLSVFVPFAMTVVLTHRPGWGFIAATLSLSETAREFQGTYPIFFYPEFASDGHIGAHMAVLIVVLLLGGAWRWGGFFLGLLPAIHPTMAAIVWPWSICYFYLAAHRIAAGEKRRLYLFICGGLAVCGALACLVFWSASNAGSPPPYESHANGGIIYHLFEATTDTHRRPLPMSSLGYSIHPLALFALIGLLFWKPRSEFGASDEREKALGLLVIGILVWAYVYLGSAYFHNSSGRLAQWVQISMPGRFSNLTALLIIPLSIAQIARSDRAPILCTVLLLLQAGFGLWDRDYLRMNLLFVILGAAFATHAYLSGKGLARWKALLALGIVAVPSAFLYFARGEKGIVYLCFGLLLATAVFYALRVNLPRWSLVASVLLAVVPSLAVPLKQLDGQHITPYDHQLSAWLTEHAAPDEPIITPMGPLSEFQLKTGHPVMMEVETLYLMTYMPALAPVIGDMARDLYGVDYSDPSQLARVTTNGRIFLGSTPVSKAWQSKTAEDWKHAGQKYNFRLVLSLNIVPIPLKPVLPGPRWTLYVIE